MEQGQVLRHDVFDFVGDVDLVAVELDLVTVHVEVGLDLREIEDTGEVEGVVHVEVNVEERFVELHGVQFVVEVVVVLFGQIRRLTSPGRRRIVDDVLLIEFDLLAVFPFFALTESYFDGQELTVFFQKPFDGSILKVLAKLIVDMEDDVGASFGLDGVLHRVLGRAFAGPVYGFRVFLVGLTKDFHYLVDVLIHFVGGHADSVIGDGECFLFLINSNAHACIAQVALHFAYRRERFEFGRSIDGIGDQFAKEDLVVGIQKFLDDGEDVI